MEYEGCVCFRQRLVLSTLSGKAVKIRNIRSKDDNPGLRDFEASFIRLLDKITNGTRVEINQTGTVLFYQPGLLIGGSVDHDCCVQRSVGYYLEALLMLAPFVKTPLRALLKGVTNDSIDPSVDLLKATALPLMKSFGVSDGLEIKVLKRGVAPSGGGEVLFSCPVNRCMKPVQLTEPGKIKRIRGTAFSVRVSPQMANRIVDSARSVLNKFIPDIYIYTDHMKGANAGKSPGYGLALVAETLYGSFLGAELVSDPQEEKTRSQSHTPEELGVACAKLLLEEIYRGEHHEEELRAQSRSWGPEEAFCSVGDPLDVLQSGSTGGFVDSTNQSLALLYMTLGKQDVSKALLGPLSSYTIDFLRHVRDFFQIMFKIETQSPGEDDSANGKRSLNVAGARAQESVNAPRRLMMAAGERSSGSSDSSSTGEEERVRRLFQTCDGDGDGYINRNDLLMVCRQLSMEGSVAEIMLQLGAGERGKISLEDFTRCRMQLLGEIRREEGQLSLLSSDSERHKAQERVSPWPTSSENSLGARESWEFDSGARDLQSPELQSLEHHLHAPHQQQDSPPLEEPPGTRCGGFLEITNTVSLNDASVLMRRQRGAVNSEVAGTGLRCCGSSSIRSQTKRSPPGGAEMQLLVNYVREMVLAETVLAGTGKD
ncbi:hypothetical protein DNTS_003287 [Danionella cerebrum]|uniref:EF-hand domain-containing protein n=1 Tax=Danionella cerebrum TaxID=2873325 RepID=A0A553MVJ4_9TELE|nr:hypothetical protein DNTS_003287 [Danionella translucida]